MDSTEQSLPLSNFRTRELDYGTLAGVLAAFGLVFVAIAVDGEVTAFLSIKAFLIVIGGTIGATLVNYPLKDFSKTSTVLKAALFSPSITSTTDRIESILALARRARAKGVLAIEDEIFQIRDKFFRKGLELVVDNTVHEEIRRILNIELSSLEDRHRKGAEIFQTMGAIAPAMGLIGTLIGLVQMLQTLNDPSQIGPAMSVALLTTFYGAILAHLVFLPFAGKLRARSDEEYLIREITIEGVIGIAQESNAQMLEQRLHSFLAPEERVSQY